jgi:biopolymer transport protein ExbD
VFELENHRRHIPEPDLVPILDALTSMIFFLLLSATFVEFTKLTLPPSQTSVISNPMAGNPLAPKLLIAAVNGKIRVTLKWGGDTPGANSKDLERENVGRKSKALESAVRELSKDFVQKFSSEKSIQLGLSEAATYQEMISAMDGLRPQFQDVVLIGPAEASQ